MQTKALKKPPEHRGNKGAIKQNQGKTLMTPLTSPGFVIQAKPICPCDGGCPRCLGVQPKLKIGKPNDKYEQEADRVADQVMKMPDPDKVQQKAGCSSCIDTKEEEPEENNLQTTPISQQITPIIQRQDEPEEEEAQMPETGETPEEEEEPVERKAQHNRAPPVVPELQRRIQSLKGGGRSLPGSVRSYFEPRFGRDFGDVRVHTDANAADTVKSIGAKAFTRGKDIVFGAGQYSPGTGEGQRLLGHELTHVVQQGSIQSNQLHQQISPCNLQIQRQCNFRACLHNLTPSWTMCQVSRNNSQIIDPYLLPIGKVGYKKRAWIHFSTIEDKKFDIKITPPSLVDSHDRNFSLKLANSPKKVGVHKPQNPTYLEINITEQGAYITDLFTCICS